MVTKMEAINPFFFFLCPVQYRHEGGPLLAASAYGFNLLD